MRRRLPLLRTVVLLTTVLVIVAVALLGFVGVPRILVAPGRLMAEGAGPGDGLRLPPGASHDGGVPYRFDCVIEVLERPSVHAGQVVTIRLDAYPWMQKGTLAGRVAMVGDVPDAGGGFPVTIFVEPGPPPGPLLDGLRGEARIGTGETESLGRLLFSRMAKGSP